MQSDSKSSERLSTPRTQAERTALSDSAMLAAAQTLILERGIEGTTLAAIGERAGYSRGLATYRYGSKAGLFREVSTNIHRRWVSYLSEAVGEETGVDAMCLAVDAYYRFVSDAPEDIRVLHILYYAGSEPSSELRDIARTAFQRQIADAERWITEGVNAGTIDSSVSATAEAAEYVAHLAGMTYLWLLNPVSLRFDEIKDSFKRSLRTRLLNAAPAT
ncbi:MAG: TetR/AcrR family transcriptional regulator [Pseudomonadota bacterium]